ncbi:MAG: hypothetical protein K6A23_08660 [Butyrivibrio sp.]|nr:hypothetical protein [Butyrivibrio sp.]
MKITGYCKFFRNLYIGDSVRNVNKVKWKLKHGAGQLSVYVITNTTTGNDQLEILHCANLKQPYYKEHPAFVYGIANGYSEAMELVMKIASEASEAGMPGELIQYLDKFNK